MDILGGRSCCMAHLPHWTGPMGSHEGWPEKVGNKLEYLKSCSHPTSQYIIQIQINVLSRLIHHSQFKAIRCILIFCLHSSDQLHDGPGRRKAQKDSLEALGLLCLQRTVQCRVVFSKSWSICPMFVGPVQKGTLWSFSQETPLTLWMQSTPRIRPGSQRRFVYSFSTNYLDYVELG